MQIGFQIRVSPLNLERVDDLVDGAQVTERWHFVADGGTQTQVAPVIKGILQGQTRIERTGRTNVFRRYPPYNPAFSLFLGARRKGKSSPVAFGYGNCVR